MEEVKFNPEFCSGLSWLWIVKGREELIPDGWNKNAEVENWKIQLRGNKILFIWDAMV